MGFNTTVIVLNDALDCIENDPSFGRKLARAVCHVSLPEKYRTQGELDVSANGFCNAASVIESHHANGNAIVAVGGNCGTRIGMTFGHHHNPEDKIEILKQLAFEMGYTLRKKTTR